jgi:hypothetical protein
MRARWRQRRRLAPGKGGCLMETREIRDLAVGRQAGARVPSGECPEGRDGRKHVEAKGLVWIGVPTDDFGGTVAFFRDVMGLEEESRDVDFAILRLPGGEAVEVFSPSFRGEEQFSTGQVVGFRVNDVTRAREEMEARAWSL